MNSVNILWQTRVVTLRPYHHGDLGPALVDAALGVVESDGIAALTLRDLTRTVGVSASAAYRHFPSRDHLVAEVSQRARQQLATALIEARSEVTNSGPRSGRALRRFAAIGKGYVRFAIEEPRLFEAAFVHCPVRPSTPDDPDAWGVLVEAIDDMADTGAIPAERRADAPIIAWSGVYGLAMILTRSIRPPDLPPTDADVALIDSVVQGIIRSLR